MENKYTGLSKFVGILTSVAIILMFVGGTVSDIFAEISFVALVFSGLLALIGILKIRSSQKKGGNPKGLWIFVLALLSIPLCMIGDTIYFLNKY